MSVSSLNQQRLVTQRPNRSYQKAALLASCWGTAISDDLVNFQVRASACGYTSR